MRRHLSEAQLVEWITGEKDSAEAAQHLAECGSCRETEITLREALELAQGVPVPEPVPAFWQSFRSSLDQRLDRAHGTPWRWRWLPALAAAALVMTLSLKSTITPERPNGNGSLPVWSPLPPNEADAGWGELVALLNDDTTPANCELVRCLVELSDEDTQRVADALQQELRRPQ